MIFTIVILILLASAIFRGFHRGFVIEMLHLIGTVVVLLFARLLYQPLGTMIS
ncbi:CvpA family protein, partial [Lactiplantibacillus plantarum]